MYTTAMNERHCRKLEARCVLGVSDKKVWWISQLHITSTFCFVFLSSDEESIQMYTLGYEKIKILCGTVITKVPLAKKQIYKVMIRRGRVNIVCTTEVELTKNYVNSNSFTSDDTNHSVLLNKNIFKYLQKTLH